jgi:protoporphyrinogen oxidase
MQEGVRVLPKTWHFREPASSPPLVVILGAGLTGLSAAYHLTRKPFLLVERAECVGGHARSQRRGGHTFDVTGHWLHLRDPRVQALVARLFRPGELVEIERRACVLSHGVLLPYPFQANLYGLPLEIVQECLVGFVEAREAAVRGDGPEPRTFEDYAIARFGRGIARHFFIPYNTKLWGVHPNCLTPAWVSRYIPVPEVDQLIGGAIGLQQQGLGYNPCFLYPKAGGIDALPKAFLRDILDRGAGELRTKTDVEEVDPLSKRIKLSGVSDWIHYDALISTIPLPELIWRIPLAPIHVQRLAADLRCVSWRYLNVATRTPPPVDYQWVYVPEERYPFFRVGVFNNAVPSMAPLGGGSLYVELTERTGAVNIPEILQALADAGAITAASDVAFAELHEIEYAYVVFDDAYEEARQTVHQWLQCVGVHSCGRYGAWIYNSMEDSIIQGMEAARWAESMGFRARQHPSFP